jgi:hypothetical protein
MGFPCASRPLKVGEWEGMKRTEETTWYFMHDLADRLAFSIPPLSHRP